MSNTLITTTKIQGPLQRLYNIRIFGNDVFRYFDWRRRCGHNYRLDIRGADDFIYVMETYEFNSMEETQAFIDMILYETDPAKNYNKPWTDTLAAVGEGKTQGILSLTGDYHSTGAQPVRLFDLATFIG
jgi:hypothetical protein